MINMDHKMINSRKAHANFKKETNYRKWKWIMKRIIKQIQTKSVNILIQITIYQKIIITIEILNKKSVLYDNAILLQINQ